VKVSPGALKAITIDAENIPDLVPILCVVSCFAQGETRITHVGRLRYKESDRLAAMEDCITCLGGIVRTTQDEIYITGTPLHGGSVSGYGDHRIVMSMAAAALGTSEPVEISGCSAVNKSYPDFFQDYQAFGGACHVLGLE
jgi:3-phosphoshikimate 1-carboxyvinyltransferase